MTRLQTPPGRCPAAFSFARWQAASVAYRAFQRKRQCVQRLACRVIPAPRMNDDGKARQLRQPKPFCHIDRAERQQPARHGRNAQTRHDGSGNSSDAAADEGFDPGYARLLQRLCRDKTHAAGLGHRDNWQGFIVAGPPVRRGKPAKAFRGNHDTVVATGILPHDNGIEFALVEPLQDLWRMRS